MPKEEELKFGDRLICRKEFKANGKLYLPGKDFPYKTIAMTFKRVQQLFSMGAVVKASSLSLDDLNKLKSLGASVPPPVDQADEPPPAGDELPPPEGEGEGEGGPVELTSEADIEVKEVATGWYDVFVDGKKVNDKSLRKRQAMKLAEEYED